MYNLVVVEDFDENIMALITENLKKCSPQLKRGIILTRAESLSGTGRLDPDILVLSSKAAAKPELSDTAPNKCKFFLAPGATTAKTAGRVHADCVISYGMSARDSITLSSMDGLDRVISLQRELVTLDGHISEQQEIPLRTERKISRDNLMAAVGALLLLGVPTENMEL